MLPRAWPVQRLWNWDREGLQLHGAGATGLIGTTAATTAITVGRVGILTTVAGDLQVDGLTTLLGGEIFDGLVTIQSAAGAGAAGALGPEEVRIETDQASTAGATIRNPGYINWRAHLWDGAATTQAAFGRFGGVVDTQAAGVASTYRMVWTNTAGTIQWSASEVGNTAQAGTGSFAAGAAIVSGTALTGTGAMGMVSAGAGSVSLASAAGTLFAGTSAGAVTVDPLTTLTLELTDNTAGALVAAEGARDYIRIGTLDVGAAMAFGNATTNPTLQVLGSGQVTLTGNVDALAGVDTTAITTSAQAAVAVGPYGAAAGNTGEVRFLELAAGGANYVGFKAADALAGDVIWTLPSADAAVAGAALTSNAAGVLSFTAAPAALANERYVIIGPASATLSDERVLTGTANQITVTDGGAGAAVTLAWDSASLAYTQAAGAAGATALTLTAGAHTAVAAAAGLAALSVASVTQTLAEGTVLASAGSVVLDAPTWQGTAGGAVETVTLGSTLRVVGPPVVGANAAITYPFSVNVVAGAVLVGNDTRETVPQNGQLIVSATAADSMVGFENPGTQGWVFGLDTAGATAGSNAMALRRGATRLNNGASSEVWSVNGAGTQWGWTQNASASGAPTFLTYTSVAAAGITAATECISANYNFSATKTWAAGAGPLATQREVVFQAPTYVGNAGGALTVTNAATVAISGAPTAGANMTITNPWSFWVQAGAVNLGGGLTTGSAAAGPHTLGATAFDVNASGAVTIDGTTFAFTGTNYTFNGTGGVGIGEAPTAHIALTANGGGALSANQSMRHLYASGNVTEANAGTHADICGLYINNFTVTDGGGVEAVTNLAGIYVVGPPIAGTAPANGPYSIFVDAGTTRLDGLVSCGGALTTGALAAGAHSLTATTFDLNASGAVTLDSSGSTITIGGDADAGAIGIGTGASARTITVGNAASTAVNMNALAMVFATVNALQLTDGTAIYQLGGTGAATLAAMRSYIATQSAQAAPGATVAYTITAGAHTAIATAADFTGSLLTSAATWTLADGATVTDGQALRFAAPTFAGLAGGGTETVDNPATVYIPAAPINGGNVTFTNLPAALRLGGRFWAEHTQAWKRTAQGAGNVTIAATDATLVLGKTAITGGGDTVTLPSAAVAGAGAIYVVKDEAGTAAANPLTINATAGNLDGAASVGIAVNYGSRSFYSDGANWFSF